MSPHVVQKTLTRKNPMAAGNLGTESTKCRRFRYPSSGKMELEGKQTTKEVHHEPKRQS